MNIQDAIKNRRTVRAFCDEHVSFDILKKICETARFYASAANLQPIRFTVIDDREICKDIFAHIRLAGYVPDYRITPQEEPPAYILLSTELEVSKNPQFDVGAAATNIMLLAKEYEMDTCCIGNFSKEHVAKILGINLEIYNPLYLIAIGFSNQKNEVINTSDTVKYEFEDGRFVVPKRHPKDIFI